MVLRESSRAVTRCTGATSQLRRCGCHRLPEDSLPAGRISAAFYEIFQLGLGPSIFPGTPLLCPMWIRVAIGGNAIPIGMIPVLMDTIVDHQLKLIHICSMMKRTAGSPRGPEVSNVPLGMLLLVDIGSVIDCQYD